MTATFPGATPGAAQPGIAEPRTSGLAVASLVCGIVGPCMVGLPSLVGFILGIAGLVGITRSGGRLRGTGMAVAGLILSAIGLALIPILVALLLPAFSRARDVSYQAAFTNNARQLCVAARFYSGGTGGKFPPPDNWNEVLVAGGYVTGREIADPGDVGAGRAFAMNAQLRDLEDGEVKSPSRTVLFFECAKGAPPAGGPELLPPEPRHGAAYVVGFVDGHVERVRPDEVGRLLWDPKAEPPRSEQEPLRA